MVSRRRVVGPGLLAGLLIVGLGGLGLQGCLATTVAGATLGVAGAAVKTTATVTKVTAKAAVGTVKVTARAVGHATAKRQGDQKPAGS